MTDTFDSRLGTVSSDIKWFLFGDENCELKNSDNFSHDLTFVEWKNDHSFVVKDEWNNEFTITVTRN